MNNTNTKIWLLLLAASVLCAGCATDTVSEKQRREADMALFYQQHAQEIIQVKNAAERAFGPDQQKWTKEQGMAYIRALYAVYLKYHPQPPTRTVVNSTQQARFTPIYTPQPMQFPTPMPINPLGSASNPIYVQPAGF